MPIEDTSEFISALENAGETKSKRTSGFKLGDCERDTS